MPSWKPGRELLFLILLRERARSKRLAQAAFIYHRYTKGRFCTGILILGQLITLTQEWRLPALPGGIHHFQSAVDYNGLNLCLPKNTQSSTQKVVLKIGLKSDPGKVRNAWEVGCSHPVFPRKAGAAGLLL